MIVQYTIDSRAFEKIKQIFAKLGAENSMENTSFVVKKTAAKARQMWQSWAMGGTIRGIDKIKRPSGKLAQSIKQQNITALHSKVYTESEEMEKIQNGSQDIHMKDLNSPWLKSKKTRIANNKIHGKYPYLIIPFSWITERKKGLGVKNVVPLRIVELLKQRAYSRVTATPDLNKLEANRYGDMIPRNSYQWGGRLGEEETDNENMAGLVNVLAGFNKNGVPSSKYFTFRVLSPYGKADWIIKGQKGIDVATAIGNELKQEFIEGVEEAIRMDLGLS